MRMRERQREPFAEGERVLIVEPRGRRHLVRLHSGELFHHPRTGHVPHDEIIGLPPGVRLRLDGEREVVCLRPSFEDYILRGLKRKTAIIHPKDLASMVIRGDLYPQARVLEAGLGSGAVAITLLRFLGPEGFLVSYERREDLVERALQNIREAGRLWGKGQACHRVVVGDVYEGIQEEDLDLVVLDLPEPHRAAAHAARALRPGGLLLSWLPTVNQVYLLVRHLQKEPDWVEVETTETLLRGWSIGRQAARPVQRMVGHTGFWVRARRLQLVDRSRQEDPC